jgi:hypothetical protein
MKKWSEQDIRSLILNPNSDLDNQKEIEKLREFKACVHQWLDDIGVPINPTGDHADAGCRVGQRLDWLKRNLLIDNN